MPLRFSLLVFPREKHLNCSNLLCHCNRRRLLDGGSSASIGINVNTVSAYATAYSTAMSAWTPTTEVSITQDGGANWAAVSGHYGNTGRTGHTSWTCNLLYRRSSVASQLNRTYLDPYPAGKRALVAMHELGHGIGVGHSTVGNPVMYHCSGCSFDAGTRTLTADDIAGANARY